MAPPSRFLETREVAEYLTQAGLQTSPSTLERWRSKGTGPDYLRVQGRVRYRLADVRRWLVGAERKPALTGTDSGSGGGERVPA